MIIELSENLIALRNREKIIIKKRSLEINPEKYFIKPGETLKTNYGIISVKIPSKDKINFNTEPGTEYISADKISDKLIIRKWREGDKFIPLGMKGEKKISDFLIDIKMNRFEKQNQFILLDGKKIIWLIGKRIDNRYKITNQTKKVLQLCWEPNKNL